MDTTANRPTPNLALRIGVIAGAIAILAVWAWAWTPAIDAWDNPSDGGFAAIPGVMATFTILPLGVLALFNALSAKAGQLRIAVIAVLLAAGIIGLVAGIEFQGNLFEAQNAVSNV